MTAMALGAAWAAVVVAAAYSRRPPPRRVRALVPAPSSTRPAARSTLCRRARAAPTVRQTGARAAPSERETRARLPWLAALQEHTGVWVLQRVGRPRPAPADPLLARRLGGALLAGLAVAPVAPLVAPAAALVAWVLPSLRRGRAERHRLAALAADLPEVVDLFVLAVGAGFTVHLAVDGVARRATGPLATELARATQQVRLGRRLADALDDVPTRAGEAVRPLIAALVASERYGASLSAGLERLADEVRRDRRRRAEEAARKVPVKLLFPLVTCTLPAFALLTVAPLIASAIRSLTL